MNRPVGLPILGPALGLVGAGALLVFLTVLLAVAGVLEALPVLGLLLPLGLLAGFGGVLLPFCYDQVRGRSSSDDRALLAENLADMLDLGVPLDEALGRLGRDMRRDPATSHSPTALAAVRAAEDLGAGSPLSAALRATRAFPSRWAALLAAGELLGDLPGALRTLARLESRSGPFPVEALLRAFVVIPVALGVALFLVTYVMPTFVSLYEGMGLDLPWASRMLFPTLKALRRPPTDWALLAGGALVLASLFVPAVREGAMVLVSRLGWGRWREQALFAGSLAAGARLGMSLPQALEVARAGAGDPAYRRAAEGFLEVPGATLAQMLDSRPDLFEPGLRWMAAQGERYGNLPEALEACAAFLEEEASRVRHRREVLLEFVLAGAVGLFVLVTTLGVMQPLVDLTTRGMLP